MPFQIESFLTDAQSLLTTDTGEALARAVRDNYELKPHGNAPTWDETLKKLPSIETRSFDFTGDTIHVGLPDELEIDREAYKALLKTLHPWRKGPWNLFGIHIDTEWRSDWKWQRLKPHISPLTGKAVLDVGCGNGYHMFRMFGDGASFVAGADPTRLFLYQFHAVRRHVPDIPLHLLPLTSEQLPPFGCFDTVFSLGVLYHRRSPLDHLSELLSFLKPGGELVLETLVVEGGADRVLVPEARYARMANVWFLPTPAGIENWLARAGFVNARTVDVNQTSIEEQRATEWMTFQSLADFLDPDDHNLTIEGLPAPRRAIIIAESPA